MKQQSSCEQAELSRRKVLMGAAAIIALQRLQAARADDSAAATQPASQPTTRPDDLRLGKLKVNKVLFVGNSITLHPPAPAIGWTGNWGMAATAADKDYVHLLLSKFKQRVGAEPASMVRNIADFERGYATYDIAGGMKDLLAFRADVVIVAIGENVPGLQSDADRAAFEKAMASLLKALGNEGTSAIFVRSCFWPDAAKDAILQKACTGAGGTFIDISALGRDPSNAARSERQIAHAGVAGHPGDKGMAAVADAIWAAIEKQ